MLTAKEAREKFENGIMEKINSEIEKSCKAFTRETVVVFYGGLAIEYTEVTAIAKLKELGYEIDSVANKSGGIITSTSSSGDPSIQLTIKW
jgi:endonuclease I